MEDYFNINITRIENGYTVEVTEEGENFTMFMPDLTAVAQALADYECDFCEVEPEDDAGVD